MWNMSLKCPREDEACIGSQVLLCSAPSSSSVDSHWYKTNMMSIGSGRKDDIQNHPWEGQQQMQTEMLHVQYSSEMLSALGRGWTSEWDAAILLGQESWTEVRGASSGEGTAGSQGGAQWCVGACSCQQGQLLPFSGSYEPAFMKCYYKLNDTNLQ